MNVEINKADLAKVKLTLAGIKNGYPKVMTRSLNKTITGVRTDAVKEIQKEITPKAKVIRKTFVLSKATYSNLMARVECGGKPLGLIHYGARQTKKGVTVQVKKSSSRTLLKHAFIATMRSGHKGVFWRKYDGPRTTGKRIVGPPGLLPYKYRLPIEELYGPRVPDIFSNNEAMKEVLKKADDRLHKNLTHELDFELSKL